MEVRHSLSLFLSRSLSMSLSLHQIHTHTHTLWGLESRTCDSCVRVCMCTSVYACVYMIVPFLTHTCMHAPTHIHTYGSQTRAYSNECILDLSRTHM